jgi:hypothetical protein
MISNMYRLTRRSQICTLYTSIQQICTTWNAGHNILRNRIFIIFQQSTARCYSISILHPSSYQFRARATTSTNYISKETTSCQIPPQATFTFTPSSLSKLQIHNTSFPSTRTPNLLFHFSKSACKLNHNARTQFKNVSKKPKLRWDHCIQLWTKTSITFHRPYKSHTIPSNVSHQRTDQLPPWTPCKILALFQTYHGLTPNSYLPLHQKLAFPPYTMS